MGIAIEELIQNIVGKLDFKKDEPMKDHTSFKIGGMSDLLVTPRSREQIVSIIESCNKNNITVFVMGNGTNLLVSDKGIRGIVMKLSNNFNNYTVRGEIIEAEAGILLSQLSNIALSNELRGLEFASGIPGTLGGAVCMNAGAYGREMKDVVIKTEYLDKDGSIKQVENHGHKFGYRSSFVQGNDVIVLKSYIKLEKGNIHEIKALMAELNQRRRQKQPINMPSAGSVFKRPEGYFAGKLIEDCGLRGYRIGGAQVPDMHCGFIVNYRNVTSEDVISLINHIKINVKSKFGIDLYTEIKVIGE